MIAQVIRRGKTLEEVIKEREKMGKENIKRDGEAEKLVDEEDEAEFKELTDQDGKAEKLGKDSDVRIPKAGGRIKAQRIAKQEAKAFQ